MGENESIGKAPGQPLWSLSYRSRAKDFPSQGELDALSRQVQARNQKCGLTGLLLYEHGRFFQWLEGPRDLLETVWRSIQADPRHHEIVVMEKKPALARLFSGWDMRVVSKAEDLSHDSATARNVAKREEVARRAADLAAENRVSAMRDLLGDFAQADGGLRHPSEVIEAVARLMGDDWSVDDWSSVDLSVALASLQAAIRGVDFKAVRRSASALGKESVLVATAPGETHLIGAVLVADRFRGAGWDLQIAFPKSDEELVEAVRSGWFTAVSLSLSDVFARLDQLAALKQTVAAVRAASMNPLVVICAGGRAFARTPDTVATQIGADTGFLSADEVVENTRLAMFAKTQIADRRSEDDSGKIDAVSGLEFPPGWYLVK